MEDSEECGSSESGWTMYLASPMQEDDNEGDGEVEDGDDGGEDDNRAWSNKDEDDDDDDDSMASDASSGPAASYIGNGKGEAKEEMKKVKSSMENLDKGGGATSKVRTKANN